MDLLTALILLGPLTGMLVALLLLWDRGRRIREDQAEMARFKIFDSANRRGHRRQYMQGKAERKRYVLVVGGCGFLGHRIIEEILADEQLRSTVLLRVFDHRKPKKSEYVLAAPRAFSYVA